jgi:hypothetical protein
MSFVGSLAPGVDVLVNRAPGSSDEAGSFFETAIIDGYVGDSTNSVLRYRTGITPESGVAWAILGLDGAIEGGPFFVTASTAYDIRLAADGENAVPPDTASRSVIWRFDSEASAAPVGYWETGFQHRFPSPGLLYTDEELVASFFADPDQLVRLTLRIYFRRVPLGSTDIVRRRRV